MSQTVAKPATTPIPVPLSEPEFTACIVPHLSLPRRGPKGKLGYDRLCNLILGVLYSGMQWKGWPVPPEAQGQPAIPDTTGSKVFARWAADGSLLQPAISLSRSASPRSILTLRQVCSSTGSAVR